MYPAWSFNSSVRVSLRLKLTVWMVLIFLVVQLSLLTAFQVYQRRSLDEFFDQRLVARQQQIAGELRPRLNDLTDSELAALAESYRRLLFQTSFVVALYDEDGDPVAASQLPRPRVPTSSWQRLRDSARSQPVRIPPSSLPHPGSDGIRAAAGWATASDGRRYLVLVAWSDVYAQQIAHLLFGGMFFSIPIGMIAMVISAYAISGVAVRPIRAMRQLARGLEPEHLDELLPNPETGTEFEKLRQDLERTRMLLASAFAAQERFMSNVSHELKTPIAVLLTEAQTLKLEGATRDVRDYVDSTVDELEKLGRMVDNFLLLTRVRHGKSEVPNRQLCTVREILGGSYVGCAGMALQHGVRLSMHLPDGDQLNASVSGNCDLLRTVVDNLVRNAIRFSSRGSIVTIDARVVDGQVRVRVLDSGPGIPEDVLPHIFDRFAQASDESHRGRGHGLGLEIAMGITELHGGTIKAANRPEGGCEFAISLPLADDGGQKAEMAALTAE